MQEPHDWTPAEPASVTYNPDASCGDGEGPIVAVGDGSVPQHIEQAALGIPLLGTVVVGWALQPQPKRGGARGPVRKPKGPRGRARQPKEAADGKGFIAADLSLLYQLSPCLALLTSWF